MTADNDGATFRAALRGPLGLFYAVTMIISLGYGLIFVFNVVYIHDIRHHTVLFATSLLALNAVLGLLAAPLTGTLTDRFGPVPVLAGTIVGESIGILTFALSSSAWALTCSMAVIAIFGGGLFGPGSALLARLSGEEHRQRAFAVNFLLLNLGLGLGGLVAALVVNIHQPRTFTVLFVGTVVLELCALVPIFILRHHGGPPPPEELTAKEREEGWGTVVADRRLRYFVLSAIVMLSCGYGSLDAGLSPFVVDHIHLSVKVVAVTLIFNTATIVGGQLLALRLLEAKSRTRILGLVGATWAVAWLIVATTVHLNKAVAVVVLCLAMSIFAVGETFWSPVGPTLVNDLAPEHLRGRYNASMSLTWGMANAIGPIIAGLFLGSRYVTWWPVAVGMGALLGGVLLVGLRGRLTAAEDGRLTPAP